VKWEKPVRKMRETIEAIRAIWDCWQNGTPLNYEGEFFKLNLMTPLFPLSLVNVMTSGVSRLLVLRRNGIRKLLGYQELVCLLIFILPMNINLSGRWCAAL
jgi:hypothetical protein